MRMIDADTLIALVQDSTILGDGFKQAFCALVNGEPTIEPERKKDTIQKFHDYQVEWLKSHYDIEFEPQLEEMIIRFLHDTANRYIMEEGEQE